MTVRDFAAFKPEAPAKEGGSFAGASGFNAAESCTLI
jgi:hypothetical protein